jgi:Ca-activated chloride channel family protein
MRFLRPEYAPWLLLLPALWSACWVQARYKRSARRRSGFRSTGFGPGDAGPQRLSHPTRRRRDVAIIALGTMAVGFTVLALMRPQMFRAQRIPQYERQDLILILDRSASMNAQDINPSRFDRAVTEISYFLRHKSEAIERVGLVGFSGTSLVLSYLTRDVDSLLFYLQWIAENPQPMFGTDIGEALASGLEVVKKEQGTSENRKIFLLVSDGDDMGGTLDASLSNVRQAAIPVYTVGIGTENDVLIPFRQPDGTEEFLRGDDGRLLHARFAENTMRQIAQTTGGRYYRSKTGSDLADAIEEVVSRERRLVGYTSVAGYIDLHAHALVIAAAALAVLVVLL